MSTSMGKIYLTKAIEMEEPIEKGQPNYKLMVYTVGMPLQALKATSLSLHNACLPLLLQSVITLK